jgi:site-specific recombinase XerC
VVRREELPAKAPRALSVEQQRRLLRIAERASARDRAVVVMLLYTGLRLAELVALDVADVRVSPRKGLVIVRSGKGDVYREVPLNALVRQVLEEWRTERKRLAAEAERAVFCRAWRSPPREPLGSRRRPGSRPRGGDQAVSAHAATHAPDRDGPAGV